MIHDGANMYFANGWSRILFEDKEIKSKQRKEIEVKTSKYLKWLCIISPLIFFFNYDTFDEILQSRQ